MLTIALFHSDNVFGIKMDFAHKGLDLYYCWDIISSMFPFHPFHRFHGGPTLHWWLNPFWNQRKKTSRKWDFTHGWKILKVIKWSEEKHPKTYTLINFLLRWTLQAIAEKAGKTLSEQVIFFFSFFSHIGDFFSIIFFSFSPIEDISHIERPQSFPLFWLMNQILWDFFRWTWWPKRLPRSVKASLTSKTWKNLK